MTEALGPPPDLEPAEGQGTNREREGEPAPGRRAFPRDPHEHYVEEAFVSRWLFAARDLGPTIVDPCAGFGTIVSTARAAGLSAYGSDLVKRAPGIAGGRDFLSERWRAPRRAGASFAIVANPPFGGRRPMLRLFAEAACARAETVALLMTAGRLAPAGAWLKTLPFAELILVRRRTSLWPGEIYARKRAAGEPLGSGYQPVVWLIFRRGFRGLARVYWLEAEA